jgi:adenylate cyclase
VAETLGVRYVLEGSIRHGGKRLRISARLVEVDTGSHVWAEQFDRVVDDLFDIQDEITKEVVTALRVQLTDGEQALVWARGTNDIEAWRCCVRATELFLQFHSSKYLEARILAERAVARDPNYAHAWAVLGFTHWWDGRLGFTGESEEKFDKAKQIADRAASLDDTVSWVIGLQTMVCSALGLYDESVALGERGIQHHPGNADVRAFLASVLTFADRPKEAIEHIRAAIALNPISPSWYLMVLSRSLAVLEEFEDALVSVDRLLSIQPLNVQALLLRTVILVRHGREMEARNAMKEVRKVAPPLRIHHLRNLFLTKNESALLFFSTALRNAGLPE